MKNEIINIDCVDFMRTLKDGAIDLVVTSPPYDTMRLYKKKCHWSMDKFTQVAVLLSRVIKPGGVIVWVVGDETKDHCESGTSFRQALFFKELGLNLYDTMIFEKANPMPGFRKCLYRQCFEYIFVFSKGEMAVFNPIMVKTTTTAPQIYRKENKWSMENGKTTSGQIKRPVPEQRYHNNIFRYNVGGLTIDHPATFPIQLAKDMIYTYSNPGQLILDPFAGSGTTNIAAYELGRNCIGCEIVEEYASLATKRLTEISSQQRIFFNNDSNE